MNEILQLYLPDLYKFLMDNGFEISLNNFIHKWFVGLFTQNFSEEYSLIIWNNLFLEGNIVLFKASLAVFKSLREGILKQRTFGIIIMIIFN